MNCDAEQEQSYGRYTFQCTCISDVWLDVQSVGLMDVPANIWGGQRCPSVSLWA